MWFFGDLCTDLFSYLRRMPSECFLMLRKLREATSSMDTAEGWGGMFEPSPSSAQGSFLWAALWAVRGGVFG